MWDAVMLFIVQTSYRHLINKNRIQIDIPWEVLTFAWSFRISRTQNRLLRRGYSNTSRLRKNHFHHSPAPLYNKTEGKLVKRIFEAIQPKTNNNLIYRRPYARSNIFRIVHGLRAGRTVIHLFYWNVTLNW